MSDTLEPQYDWDEWDEEVDPIPASVLVFSSPELDRDESIAGRAADKILAVHRRLVDDLCELEWMERALRAAEPVSARAREARAEIVRAITCFDEIFGGTDSARCALIFRWESEARAPVGNVA